MNMTIRAIMLSFLAVISLAACAKEKAAPAQATVKVRMETTLGDIVVELYPGKAPVTVANFLAYVDGGYYDGAAFYRATRPDNDPMIEVIQGGLWEPEREGEGGYAFKAPFADIAHETTAATGLSHVDGAISMARDAPGTASSEFFICVGDNPELDYGGERNPDGQGFAAFGKVIEGMDVVRAIDEAPTGEGEGFKGQLLSPAIVINSMRREP